MYQAVNRILSPRWDWNIKDNVVYVQNKEVTELKFNKNDRVIIVSDCNTTGRTGTVVGWDIDHCSWSPPKYEVKLDCNGAVFKYNEGSLEFYDKQEGGNKMAKLTGYSRVAEIEINNRPYYYALYDDETGCGDKVLVTGAATGKLYTISCVWSKEDAAERYKGVICEEVICKVDQSAYEKRVADRAEKAKIRKEMDAMIKKMDETQKYKMYADMNPELAELLKKFEALEG